MNDVIIVVDKNAMAYKKCSFQKIGNEQQNLQNKLKFGFEDEIVEGQAWLEFEIDGVKKYTLMEKYENGYQIDIKDSLLTGSQVSVDLKITQDEEPEGVPVFITNIITFDVEKTINAEEEEPDNYPDWFESANKIINEANNLNLDINKNDNVSTITINKKDGTQKSVDVYDGLSATIQVGNVTLGPQKKSRVMTDSDKYLTAVHEAGHAIVCKDLQKNVTVHEVSIIPRGYAGGYTQMRPTDDSTYQKKSDLLNDIAVALGGRMAEKLYLDDISTGASGDLEQATKIARAMVVTFGMSEEVGLVHLGGNDNEFFLGRDYQSRLNYSEKEAALIDAEIRKLINSAQTMAEKVLTKHKKALHVLVDCLLEKETVYADEIDQIMQGKTKEEVLAYIEQKTAHKESLAEDKKESKNETSDKQNKTQTQTTATSIKATTEERESDQGAKAEEKGIEENKKQTLGEDEKRSETKKSVKKSNATTKKTSGTSARKTTKKQAQRSTKNAKLDTKEDAE